MRKTKIVCTPVHQLITRGDTRLIERDGCRPAQFLSWYAQEHLSRILMVREIAGTPDAILHLCLIPEVGDTYRQSEEGPGNTG